MSEPSGIEATAAGQKEPEGSGVGAIGVDNKAVDPRQSEGREAILGETAQVIRAPQDDSRGMLRFATPKLGSEEWEFICEQPVVMGDRVIVKDVSGNTLIVTRR